ncbi:MAG: methyltransferase domain-containing protein [Proteobacteria bacterium]|nr:methyltransferase domain-containing protein [Pseudomonadota bacterium]HQR04001.1 glycosyltransferase family 9 protein [Rhodocyclaceae bacterium]
MKKFVDLFFRITNRLFVFFITALGFLWREKKRFNPAATDGRKLLVVRHGGLGDLLFISPIIAEMKLRYPDLRIDLMTHPGNHAVFQGHPGLGHLIQHRWPDFHRLFGYDYIIFLDGVIELDAEAKTRNIYDLLSEKYFGITLPPERKKPIISLSLSAQHQLLGTLDPLKTPSPKIGLQLCANSPVRTPDIPVWTKVVSRILSHMPDAALFLSTDARHQPVAEQLVALIRKSHPDVSLTLTAAATPTVESLVALVSLMDLVVAPDSSMSHMAAAFDIPALGIYGPFPSALRTKYYRNAIPIDVKADCAPCFTHGHWPCKKAKEQNRINSPCFDSLEEWEIDAALGRLTPLIQGRKALVHGRYRYFRYATPTYRSETSKFRAQILSLIKTRENLDLSELNGVDIGCGGDPLLPESIAIDLPQPYAKCGTSALHLKGNADRLPWLATDSLDYVYSSHLFEDFPEPDNRRVLKEWMRVLKPGGLLILLLPDQPRYLEHCKQANETPNEHHSIPTFGIEYLKKLVEEISSGHSIETVGFWETTEGEYNFLATMRKPPAPGTGT